MAGNFEDLDFMFALDEAVNSEELRAGYEILVSRLRKESKDLPLNTAQQILIERLAHEYVTQKWRESLPLGTANGFANITAMRDAKSNLLAMIKELNAGLARVDDESRRKAWMREMQEIIVSTIAKIDDQSTRAKILNMFAASFKEAGL